MTSSDLVNAIQAVETGGHPDPPNALGDGGEALGPLQIHRACWLDAVEHRPDIGGTYDDCRNLTYATQIFWSYMDRYAPDDSHETMSRTWNGGPNGYSKAATHRYWKKVKLKLASGG